ncbi:MAG: hypothetical protein NWF03_07710 [Candidatus Bathyarchaeota archaeon]|nr:hypothetical protein [Candidatus Bathyarchaeota archaeon]
MPVLVFPANAETDSWTTLAEMPTARAGLGVAVVDRKIYAIGGYNGNYLGVNEMYDPKTDTWTTIKQMPTPRTDFAVAVYQNKIYCIGGMTNGDVTGKTEVYDPTTNMWETKTSMPTPRCSLEANVANGKIYLVGGKTTQYIISTKNEVYNPATDSWSTTAPDIPSPLYYYASVVIDDEIYIIGGNSYRMAPGGGAPPPPPVNETWIYETQTAQWHQGISLSDLTTTGDATVTTGVDAPQRIYVIGGYRWLSLTTPEVSGQVSVYNPTTKTWTFGEDMPTSRVALAVAVVNDKIYAIGGYESDLSASTVNEQYTPIGYEKPKVMSVFVDSPTNKTYYTDTIKLQFVINKSVSLVTYSLDNKDNVSITENPTLTLSDLSDGSHSITVYAQDTQGNYAKSQTAYFTVQTHQKTLLIAVIGVAAITATAIICRYKIKRATKKSTK